MFTSCRQALGGVAANIEIQAQESYGYQVLLPDMKPRRNLKNSTQYYCQLLPLSPSPTPSTYTYTPTKFLYTALVAAEEFTGSDADLENIGFPGTDFICEKKKKV